MVECGVAIAWLLGVGLLVTASSSLAVAAEQDFWALSPYRMKVQLAVDTFSLPSHEVAQSVSDHIQQRVDATIGANWNLEVEILPPQQKFGALQRQPAEWLTSHEDSSQALQQPAEQIEKADAQIAGNEQAARKPDKRVLLVVRETALGVVIAGAEQDTLLERVGRSQQLPPCEYSAAPEAAFTLLTQLFSPVATFSVVGDKKDDVELVFRGSALPQKSAAEPPVTEGSILLPILRRTDRDGTVAEQGIQEVPWTYLLVSGKAKSDGIASAYRAKIYSHTRRPFGARRRGRVAQYAVLLPPGEGSTEVYLHARDRPDVPLSGYQGFLQDGENAARVPIGSSDIDGMLRIKPGKSSIQVLYVKSGSKVVAKAPIAVGAVERVTIPLLDERKRLEAEAKLSILREELIDLVARRSILAGRIRTKIGQGELPEARKLLVELNDMPGRAQFSQRLTRTRQQAKSSDPRVQKRIEELFAETESVLGAFLSTRELRAVTEELATAERAGKTRRDEQSDDPERG